MIKSISNAVLAEDMAKNSLTIVYGFSLDQLLFGFNPKLPNIFVNRPPALEEPNVLKLVADN